MTNLSPPWEPPMAGDELSHITASLERLRATFAYKVADLDGTTLQFRVASSSLTLGGLLKHLARCEDEIFTRKLFGEPMPEPWQSAPWREDPDWDFNSAHDDSPELLYARWMQAVLRSRHSLARALNEGGLDHEAHLGWNDQHVSLRRLLFDLIEEYGRHTGHADFIREAIDGRTGEDPPSEFPWPTPFHC
jgi:uncharacterized damage-inducible protein DinB